MKVVWHQLSPSYAMSPNYLKMVPYMPGGLHGCYLLINFSNVVMDFKFSENTICLQVYTT